MMKIAAVENNILAIVAGTFAATIVAEDIEPQFHALTHFPDRRAKAELADLGVASPRRTAAPSFEDCNSALQPSQG